MDDARWIGWAVSTAYGQRYDVKSFTVTLTVLRALLTRATGERPVTSRNAASPERR